MSEETNQKEETKPVASSEEAIIAQIKEVLEKLAVFIQKDGGDIQFQGWDPKTGTVYVTLSGACQGCMYIDQTMTMGVEAIMQEEVPGVNAVKVIDPNQVMTAQD
ncbi:MAG: NifU family protein [Bacilli bacterium]|jgi:Fe-S cluster biogenesis protein NfuA|nr:NifU family protein [Bacilli bacterium]